MYKLVILDRDGVVTKEKGHVRCVEELEILPKAGEAVARLNRAGVKVVLATNQSGIARGYLTMNQLREIHDCLENRISEESGFLNHIYVSPYLPEGASGDGLNRKYVKCHEDRKPGSGMLIKAMADFGVSPDQACMVGDSWKDVVAAQNAGVDFYGIASSKREELKQYDVGVSTCLMSLIDELEEKGLITKEA